MQNTFLPQSLLAVALLVLAISLCKGQAAEEQVGCSRTDKLTQSANKMVPSGAEWVTSKVPLGGYFYVKTDIRDSTELGGYSGSRNRSHDLCQIDLDLSKGFLFVVDTNKYVQINADLEETDLLDTTDAYERMRQKQIDAKSKSQPIILGRLAYIINNTDSIWVTEASDSRIDVVMEAMYKGEWRSVEYLSSSSCGNSYHLVYLKPGRYWSFGVPQYVGPISVQLRYRLDAYSQAGKKTTYSNEFRGGIHRGQLMKAPKRKGAKNIMDPYE